MNDRLFRTILKKYEAEIEDAKCSCVDGNINILPSKLLSTGIMVDTTLPSGLVFKKLSLDVCDSAANDFLTVISLK